MSTSAEDARLSPHARTAWLELGGYVAGADGLSDDETEQLGASAVSPDFDLEACREAIRAGAARTEIPSSAVDIAREADPFVRVQCLLEIAAAAESDGLSTVEETRLRQVVEAVIGTAKAASFLRLHRLQKESGELLRSLVVD